MRHKKIKASPDVTCTDLEDEGALLNLETRDYYTLNKPGVYVWQLINDGLDPEEIVRKVQQEFEVDQQTAEENVSVLIDELLREKLVHVVD